MSQVLNRMKSVSFNIVLFICLLFKMNCSFEYKSFSKLFKSKWVNNILTFITYTDKYYLFSMEIPYLNLPPS